MRPFGHQRVPFGEFALGFGRLPLNLYGLGYRFNGPLIKCRVLRWATPSFLKRTVRKPHGIFNGGLDLLFPCYAGGLAKRTFYGARVV
jgi:hypothetical protein